MIQTINRIKPTKEHCSLKYVLFLLLFINSVVFSQEREKIIEKGLAAYFKKDTIVLKESTNKLLNLYNQTNDSIALAKYYHFKALYYKIIHKNENAYYHYQLSKNISIKLKDSLAIGKRLIGISVLQRLSKDFLGSEINTIEALKYLEPIRANKFLVNAYNNLGLVSEELNKGKEALKCYNKALETNKLTNKSYWREKRDLNSINNIGLLYQRMKEQKKAIPYFNLGLTYDSIKEKHPLQYTYLLENLAASNFFLGNKKDVLRQYEEVINVRNKINNLHNLSTTYINVSNYYSDINQNEKAKFYSIEALKYAKQTHNNKRWLEALENLSELTKGEEAKEFFRKYIKLNDSLIEKERKLKNQFARIQYETGKKEKENIILRSEKAHQQEEITYQKQQKTIGWLLAIISMLGLGLSTLFFVLKRRKTLHQNQLQKVETTYKERDRISRELHDGILGRLFGTRFGLGFLNIQGDSETIKQHQRFLKELQEIEKEIRDVSHKLSYKTKEELSDFTLLIEQLLIEKSMIGNFDYKLQIAPNFSWSFITEKEKNNLYRVLQEVIQNVIKHSKAKSVTVSIETKNNNVEIQIEDDGIGFKKDTSKKGIGITNITSRVEELKGKLLIESTENIGTIICITIPTKKLINKLLK
ncbi:tetratricopeptide repeat-containing sensor histidine kinase [uncultured Tenacibaculum sp.]|uniref:tetratricopeptide repeat-containing sensor histidine kinase n=1 Tax=uncultured Tenacibaculum sp. TaxID=174713 RepID=UPI0026234B83|nr:tetratricopeptide repeat-containing sensor histidine kinase [uncultured Tenacibaculum sp.]